MSTDPTPWEVIRAAADRLERVARWADKGPWVDVQDGWCIRAEPSDDKATWRTVASDVGRANSDWITTLSPTVAEPLVAWLRDAGDAWEIIGVAMWPPATVSYRAALDFAHKILESVDRG